MMLYALPLKRVLGIQRRRTRYPTSADVSRALREAQAVRAGLNRDVAALLRGGVVSILLGGVVPLALLLAYRAPMWSVMLLLACDLVIAAAADLLMAAIAHRQCTRTLESLAASEDAFDTIEILRRQPADAFSESGLQALARAAAAPAPVQLPDKPLRALGAAYLPGFLLLFLLVFALPYIVDHVAAKPEQLGAYLREIAPFLLVSLVLRLGSALRVALLARRADRAGPELLPQFPIAGFCLGVGGFMVLLAWFFIDQPLLRQVGPSAVVVLNATIGLLLCAYGYARLHRAARGADWLLRKAQV